MNDVFVFGGNLLEEIECSVPKSIREEYGWDIHSKEELREIINEILNN